MSNNGLEVLEHYNRKLQKYAEIPNSEAVLLKSLSRLDQVRVNISLLQQTGVGRTVSSLKKKYPDSEIGALSKDLVAKWKDVVTQEENEEGQGEEEGKDSGQESGEELTQPVQDYVPTPIVPSYVPTPIPKLEEVKSGEEREERKRREKEERRNSEKEERRNSEKEKKRKEEKEAHRSKEKEKEKSKESSKHREEKERKEKDAAKKSSSSSKTSSSSSKSSSRHSSSSSSRHKEEGKKEERKEKHGEVKVKKEIVESSQKLNGFDFLKDTVEEPSKEDRKRKEEKRKEKVKTEPKDDDAFASAVGGLTDTFKKPKRRHEEEEEERRSKKARKEERSSSSSSSISSSSSSSIPDISPHYKGGQNSVIPDISPVYQPPPRPTNPILTAEPKKKPRVDHQGGDDETFAIILANKNNSMGALYSGTARSGFSAMDKFGNKVEVPRLYDQCMQVLKNNVESIDETGNIPFDILKPVLEHAPCKVLMHIEECNPYLMEDTGDLWEKYVKRDFRNKAREDMESFREMYERCEVQREERLNALKGKVKNCYKTEKDKHRQTKMAYDDVAPKAPRSVKVAQVKNGTFVATGSSLEGVKRARTSDPTAGKNMMGSRKPARAPLMAAARRMAGIRR